MEDKDQAENPVRQLRLVVEAEDFEEALRFYRDVLGMPQQEAYDGDDDARVVILDAGRATLELSNPAQVRFIDRVETDGHRSPKLRVAFEVDDTAGTTEELVAGGAELLAEPRETPWRSLNSRLSAPGGLTVTLFQELDEPGRAGTHPRPERQPLAPRGPAVQAGDRAQCHLAVDLPVMARVLVLGKHCRRESCGPDRGCS